MQPQNRPPWQKDYFELIIFEKLINFETQEKVSKQWKVPFCEGHPHA